VRAEASFSESGQPEGAEAEAEAASVSLVGQHASGLTLGQTASGPSEHVGARELAPRK